MKLWIRLDADAPDDPHILDLADVLGIDPAHAFGCCAAVWCRMAPHATDGDLSTVRDATLERWAGWTGARGVFAAAFRAAFAAEGVVGGWDARQGKLIARQDRERERLRAYRERTARNAASERDADATPSVRVHNESVDAKRTRTRRAQNALTERNGTERNEEQERPASPTAQQAASADADRPPDAGAGQTAPDRACPWMGEVRRLWAERFGSAARPPAAAPKVLRPVVDSFGEPGMLARLEVFLATADARFVDLHRFARTPDAWGTPDGASTTPPAPVDGPALRVARGGQASADPVAAALAPDALRALFAQHDLDRPGEREAYRTRLAQACPAVVAAEAWRVLVYDHIRPWELGAITFPPEARAEIARRLAAARAAGVLTEAAAAPTLRGTLAAA